MDEQNNTDGMLAIHESIKDLSLAAMSSLAKDAYYGVSSDVEREQIKGIFRSRALEIGKEAVRSINCIFASLDREKRTEETQLQRSQAIRNAADKPVWLDLDKNGAPIDSLNNYLAVMRSDEGMYPNIKYNLLKAAPEIHIIDHLRNTVTIRSWEDADEAESQRFIEEKYHIFSDMKHKKALTLLFHEREYNPVLDIVDRLPPWDGVERIGNFLVKYMGCEDTAYTREVSRLIFAGGINRLYNPGCKFDDVVVLVGTKQGEGKSSIIRWLAIHDDYYSEVTQFEGNQAVEQLEGAWICEISEMLALTKTTEQEAVKAYITRQVDKYRKPYARNPSNLPRRCTFLGTTNTERFLKDKTGNRRWYPVKVNMSGYDLYGIEAECREYILLCWAEARDKLKQGKMPNFAKRELIQEYRAAQANSMEDDWRESAISDYLAKYSVGDRVCIRQVAREALPIDGDAPKDPTRKEAHEIGLIIDKMSDWKRFDGSSRINDTYGKQRGWIKVSNDTVPSSSEDPDFELPF